MQSQTADDSTLWTKKDAAKFLKISMSTLKNWMNAGTIPYYRFGHRTVRFKPADLQAHLDKSCRVHNDVAKRLRG